AGGVRHQVAVTEQHPGLDPSRVPMVFDLSAGLYWRPEEGGLLFGMSNPAEPPGENRSVDLEYLARMRTRLEILAPVTAASGRRPSTPPPAACRASGRRRTGTARCPASRWPAPAAPG